MLMGVVTCVLISYIFFPSSPTVGAFPAFWKAVNGVNLFYLLCLFAMAFQVLISLLRLVSKLWILLSHMSTPL